MHRLADLQVADDECEQLDLRELVDAVQALGLLTGRPRFGAEAVRQPAQQLGKILGVAQRVGQHAAQRDLCGADQAQIGVLDAVHLRRLAAWVEAQALQDRSTRQVRRGVQRKPVLGGNVDRVALERQVEQHRLVLEVVELVADDLGPRREVDEVERLGDLEVVLGLKAFGGEVPRLAPGLEHGVVVVARPVRHVGVGQVGHATPGRIAIDLHGLGVDPQLPLPFPELPPFLDERDSSCGLLLLGQRADLAHPLGVLLLLGANLLLLRQQVAIALVELGDPIDGLGGPAVDVGRQIREHRRVAGREIVADAVGCVSEELDVQHGAGKMPLSWASGRPLLAR